MIRLMFSQVLLITPMTFCLPFTPPWFAFGVYWVAGGAFPNLTFDKSGVVSSVDCLSVKLAYSSLLKSAEIVPHCISKSRPVFGDLYWSTTWSQVHILPFNRPVNDFAWLLAHGVVFTADRLLLSFGISSVARLFLWCSFEDSFCFLNVLWLRVFLVGCKVSLFVLLGFDTAEFSYSKGLCLPD